MPCSSFLSYNLFLYPLILLMRARRLWWSAVVGGGLREMDLARGGLAASVAGLLKTAVRESELMSGPNTLSYAYFFKILERLPICECVPLR